MNLQTNKMFGGGFLRQMNETIKYNRDLLRKSTRKPFERSEIRKAKEGDNADQLVMSDSERNNLLVDISLQNKKARIKSMLIFIAAIILTALLLAIFMLTWGKQIKDFLSN